MQSRKACATRKITHIKAQQKKLSHHCEKQPSISAVTGLRVGLNELSSRTFAAEIYR